MFISKALPNLELLHIKWYDLAMSIHVFGIRHHGPGCARALLPAIEELEPSIILMEGPADAQSAVPLAGHDEMVPPVAMLLYPKDEPQQSTVFPLTVYSPEWQSMRWAAANGIPVQLMDLPISSRQQLMERWSQQAEEEGASPKDDHDETSPPSEQPSGGAERGETPPPSKDFRTDPLAVLAEAAGYKDHELWWEEQIERRINATGLFEAILEAMRAVREEMPECREIDLVREAFMRKTIRAAKKAGHERIAVICGAWHAPVLDEESIAGKRDGMKIKDDTAKLKGLKKSKIIATWIPWTHSRFAFASGYGAGVTSPGWYAHLWESPLNPSVRWLSSAARLLRERDIDASSASVIEASRLADSLAAMRELRSPGLRELNESILSVLCHGNETPLRLIQRHLEIGDVLGTVPAEAPTVPLAKDLEKLQKALRLKPSTESKLLDLDLRKESGLGRSHLLHRLNLLDIDWGEFKSSGSATSTFHEYWQLEWQPEFAVKVIEANVWGNTVEAAATARVIDESNSAQQLADVTLLLDVAILGGLTDAIGPLLECVQSRAAVSADVRHLMEGVLPLARISRYSDVRKTSAEQVEPILLSMFERILVGLVSACSAIDDANAEALLESMVQCEQALSLVNMPSIRDGWTVRLRELIESSSHGLIRGWATRILLEQGAIDGTELYRLTRVAVSPAAETSASAAWITGLLKGSAMLLLHQDSIWPVIDQWLRELNPETFTELLAVIRRAFSDFTPSERRQMGERVKKLSIKQNTPNVDAQQHHATDHPENLHPERMQRVLPILTKIVLGS